MSGALAIFGLARLSLGERLLMLCSEVSETQRLAAVGQLAAGLFHEIRNPVGFVSANLQQLGEYADDLRAVLASQTVSDPKTQSLLHEIMDILQESLRGTTHIASLTRDVLGLTRKDQEYTEPVELFETARLVASGERARQRGDAGAELFSQSCDTCCHVHGPVAAAGPCRRRSP